MDDMSEQGCICGIKTTGMMAPIRIPNPACPVPGHGQPAASILLCKNCGHSETYHKPDRWGCAMFRNQATDTECGCRNFQPAPTPSEPVAGEWRWDNPNKGFRRDPGNAFVTIKETLDYLNALTTALQQAKEETQEWIDHYNEAAEGQTKLRERAKVAETERAVLYARSETPGFIDELLARAEAAEAENTRLRERAACPACRALHHLHGTHQASEAGAET
jgi:hypothetical protein